MFKGRGRPGGKEPGPWNRVSQSYSLPLLLRWEGEKIAGLEMRVCLNLLTGGSLEMKEVKAALSEFSCRISRKER